MTDGSEDADIISVIEQVFYWLISMIETSIETSLETVTALGANKWIRYLLLAIILVVALSFLRRTIRRSGNRLLRSLPIVGKSEHSEDQHHRMIRSRGHNYLTFVSMTIDGLPYSDARTFLHKIKETTDNHFKEIGLTPKVVYVDPYTGPLRRYSETMYRENTDLAFVFRADNEDSESTQMIMYCDHSVVSGYFGLKLIALLRYTVPPEMCYSTKQCIMAIGKALYKQPLLWMEPSLKQFKQTLPKLVRQQSSEIEDGIQPYCVLTGTLKLDSDKSCLLMNKFHLMHFILKMIEPGFRSAKQSANQTKLNLMSAVSFAADVGEDIGAAANNVGAIVYEFPVARSGSVGITKSEFAEYMKDQQYTAVASHYLLSNAGSLMRLVQEDASTIRSKLDILFTFSMGSRNSDSTTKVRNLVVSDDRTMDYPMYIFAFVDTWSKELQLTIHIGDNMLVDKERIICAFSNDANTELNEHHCEMY